MILITFTVLFILLVLFDWIRTHYGGNCPHIPLFPRFVPLLGNLPSGDLNDFHHSVSNVLSQFPGRIGRYFLLGEEVIVASDPEALKALNNVQRDRPMMAELICLARGITSLPAGKVHSALRKFFHPFINSMQYQPFQEPTLRKHCEILTSLVLVRAREGTCFNFDELLEKSMFDLATDLVAGFNPSTIQTGHKSLHEDWALINEALAFRNLTKAVPYWKNPLTKTRYHVQVDEARDRVDALMRTYVTQCHAACAADPTKKPTSAMEYYFLSPEKDAACELTDEQVIHHTLNLVWGAADSTKLVTLFLCGLVSLDSRVEAKLLEEIQRVLGDADTPTNTQLARDMPYLNACLLETLRLYPPFPLISSTTTAPVSLAGHSAPAGISFWNVIWASHRDPKYWGQDVELFRPERFLESESSAMSPAFNPFGSGSRRCPGERLGIFDVKYFAATLLNRFHFEIPDPAQMIPIVRTSLCLPKGLYVRAIDRRRE